MCCRRAAATVVSATQATSWGAGKVSAHSRQGTEKDRTTARGQAPVTQQALPQQNRTCMTELR